jgi:small-conductance mechanosensitive channel
MRLRMKLHQWMATLGLLGLVLAIAVGLILTREPEQSNSNTGQMPGGEAPLIDEHPLQTARTLATLASGPDERRLAEQAMKVADHELDLAFASGLRDAAEHSAPSKPETKELYARASQAQARVKADQDRIDQLTKQLASASGAREASLRQQIDLAHAQHEYGQDELDDANEDLSRSGGDPLSRIQRQFNQHEAAEHQYDLNHPQIGNYAEANYLARNLVAQMVAWHSLHSKMMKLLPARDEARRNAETLQRNHDALQAEVSKEAGTKQTISEQSNQINSAATPDASSAAAASSAITSLRHLSVNQKDLSDLNKRIQDHQELATVYDNWIGLVKSHELAAVHGMLWSFLLIALILLAVYIAGRIVDHFIIDVKHEWTRLKTLRVVIRFAVQAVGVLLILFVLFGIPNQMPTILGLAGAGLTVALKDFIVAFVGWFVLMGRNGIRVGDWVEINGVVGEVVEINLLRTMLLETGNWTDTGHPTGRKVAFVNSYAIEGHFFNFSTSGQWLWDEIEILVPSSENPYPIIDAIHKLVEKDTQANAQAAEHEWQSAMGSYRTVQSVSAAPAINLRPTTSGVEVHVRYITRARERFATRTRLYQALVELLHHRHVEESEAQNVRR